MSAYLLAAALLGFVSICSGGLHNDLIKDLNMKKLLNKELANGETRKWMDNAIRIATAKGCLDDSFDDLPPLEQLKKLNDLKGCFSDSSNSRDSTASETHSTSMDPETRAQLKKAIKEAKEAGYLDDSVDDLTRFEQMNKLTELERSIIKAATSHDQEQVQSKSSTEFHSNLGLMSNSKPEVQQHVAGSSQSDREIIKKEGKVFMDAVKKHHSEVKQDIQGIGQRVKDLEDRLDGDMATALDDIVTRIEVLESHRETTHKILKKMKAIKNNHLHNCGPAPDRNDTIVTEGDGIATYKCKPGFTQYRGKQTKSTCLKNGKWSAGVDIVCYDLTNCQAMQKKGGENYRAVYAGTVNVTKKGGRCQPWIKRKPHDHFYRDRDFVETSGTGKSENLTSASNYCRDPGHFGLELRVWCYTDDANKRWEACDVKSCNTDVPRV